MSDEIYCQRCLEPYDLSESKYLCPSCQIAEQVKADATYHEMRDQEKMAQARHLHQIFKEDGLLK